MTTEIALTPLDAQQPHSQQQATYLGKACELAYLPATTGPAAFRDQLQLEAQLISVDNTQAYVGHNDQNIVVAFRGSESFMNLDGFKDWLLTNARNFLILPEGRIGSDFAAAGVGARFHSGFLGALDEIWQPLFDSVDRLFGQQERPVWITGHSLGGALALLCGWRFHQHFVSVHQICTFGAPMIGNAAAAAAFQREFPGKIFRYVDSGDLVPRLPTISLFSNAYMHCQQEVLVGDSPNASVWQNLTSSWNEAATAVSAGSFGATAGDGSTSAQGDPLQVSDTGNARDAESLSGTEKLSGTGSSESPGLSAMLIQKIWQEIAKGMPSHMMGNYLGRLMNR